MDPENTIIMIMFKLRLDGTRVMSLVVKPTGLPGRAYPVCVDYGPFVVGLCVVETL